MKDSPQSEALANVLVQSEHVESIVEKCADEISSVNQTLTRGLPTLAIPESMAAAIGRNTLVEARVEDASDKLAWVNEALKAEVEERTVLEDRLSAMLEQSERDRARALHDPLTGLPNRALFLDRLEQGLAQAARYGRSLAVMFLDLDNFKTINDTYGHEAGDAVLRTMAVRLKAVIRRNDTICRHGGDEFLYLAMEASRKKDVAGVAQKLLNAVKAPCSIPVNNQVMQVEVLVSIGIATLPKHGTTAAALIGSADAAMYRAKREKLGFTFAT